MSYAFREATVSGHLYNVEGTSAYIKIIQDALVNDMGWVLVEDSTALASPNHLLILHNNGGESGSDPNYYLILNSGTINEIGFKVATAWDVGSPGSVPGSGFVAPGSFTTTTLETDEDGLFRGWIAGDKDAVNFVTETVSASNITDFDLECVGRALQFHNETLEPYSIYLFGTTTQSTLVETNSVFGLVGNDPIIAITASNDGEIQAYPQANQSEPWNLDEGADQVNYTGVPYLWSLDDATNKGSIGLLRHIWAIRAPGAPDRTILRDEESNDEYIVFQTGGTRAFMLRKI